MSDRSHLTVILNDAPHTLPPALAAALAGHDHREAGEFTWEETLLARGQHLAHHLRQIDPDLECFRFRGRAAMPPGLLSR